MPGFAFEPDFSITLEVLHGDSCATYDRSLPGDRSTASQFQQVTKKPYQQHGKSEPQSYDEGVGDTETRNATIKHDDCTEYERGDAA
jgi:hypothetical protein